MTRPLPQLLAEIDALLAKATRGPWKANDCSDAEYGPTDDWSICRELDLIAVGCCGNDAALITTLHASYPQLREAAQDHERMREALEEVTEALHTCHPFTARVGKPCSICDALKKARAALARKEP